MSSNKAAATYVQEKAPSPQEKASQPIGDTVYIRYCQIQRPWPKLAAVSERG